MSETLELKLLGKDYKLACPDGERDTVLSAVALVEGKLNEFGARTRSTGERLAMMVALDLAAELRALQSTPADAVEALARESIQRRIDFIEARIASTLERHQELF